MVPNMTIRKEKFDNNLFKMGDSLRKLRENRHFTIEQFAEKTDLSTKTIGNCERGLNFLSIESIVKIYRSNVFNLTLSELLEVLIVQIYE